MVNAHKLTQFKIQVKIIAHNVQVESSVDKEFSWKYHRILREIVWCQTESKQSQGYSCDSRKQILPWKFCFCYFCSSDVGLNNYQIGTQGLWEWHQAPKWALLFKKFTGILSAQCKTLSLIISSVWQGVCLIHVMHKFHCTSLSFRIHNTLRSRKLISGIV